MSQPARLGPPPGGATAAHPPRRPRHRPLDEGEIARAVVESVAENTSDAVVAPLVLGALAGVPGLLAYRAANTLDAMVGHRSSRYLEFGWASARLDDVLNLPGARLTAVLAALLGPSPRDAFATWARDASAHPSPNAGPVEASFAGALGIRLGGENTYGDRTEHRAVLGSGRPAEPRDIQRAVDLARRVDVAAAVVAVLVAGGRGRSLGERSVVPCPRGPSLRSVQASEPEHPPGHDQVHLVALGGEPLVDRARAGRGTGGRSGARGRRRGRPRW